MATAQAQAVRLPLELRHDRVLAAVRAFPLFYIIFAFSDGVNFLAYISPYLLYVMYAAVFGSVVASVVMAPQRNYQYRVVLVYGFWLVFYFTWTLLVLPNAREQMPEVIRVLIRDATVLAAIPVVLRNRPNLQRLANGFQLVVLVNCAICIWESLDPTVIWAIANMRAEDISVVDPNRAAALWYNPNPAAFGFLIGALMSRWSRGWLVVTGRIAALVGIYLTVSRSGLYMLLLCGALYGTFRLRGVRMNLRRWVLAACGLALVLAVLIGVVAAGSSPLLPENGGGNWNVQRLLDVQEENSGDLSRVQLSEVALRAALRGPWYGRGTFIFQGSPDSPFKAYTNVGAHNIYIVVVGEAGLAGVAGFGALLLAGICLTFFTPMPADDRFVLGLLWMIYLFIGLVNHNQFTSFQGTIYAGLLAQVPWAARTLAAETS